MNSLAGELLTWTEGTADSPATVRLRTRVRTNAGEARLRHRLEQLGLLDRVETLTRITTNWFWTGTGQGYEILWRDPTTIPDLLPLARL